ncbi:hypothetical protein [Komagataeibacter saccharivorans]|uniref:hypothetical protein n=1 Tax=Komagataeibacter saccharivorans TaxID=265959 RepID=UPI000C863496|nr:hypothetical protein [Komagataeibacter saccharivorans]
MAAGTDALVDNGIHSTDWVSRLSSVILFSMLLYSVVGIPDFNRTAAVAASTDHVSPVNRFIWLGLLSLSLPLIRARWQAVLQLVRSSWLLIGLFLYFTCSTTWALDPTASSRRIISHGSKSFWRSH